MIYLATPFTGYYLGHKQAWIEACRLNSSLMAGGLQVYSPIVHGYAMVLHGCLPAVDAVFWEQANRPYMEDAAELYVAMMDGWKQSKGIEAELEYFRDAGKPVSYLNPHTMRLSRERTR